MVSEEEIDKAIKDAEWLLNDAYEWRDVERLDKIEAIIKVIVKLAGR